MNDEEILKYDKVPVAIAAQYLDVSPQFIRIGLQRNKLPFGTAVQYPSGQYVYHISPGLLVSYKTGKDCLQPVFKNFKDVIEAILRDLSRMD